MTWRETLSLTQAALAAKAGISVSYLAMIERGKSNPTITTMQAIAAVLGTTVAELLDVDGDELGMAATRPTTNIVVFKK